MNDYIKNLYIEMTEDVREFSEIGQPAMNRLGGALRTMRDVLLQLRAHVLLNGFKDDEDEIAFFKYDKPKFVAEQIYLTEMATVLLGRPGSDEDLLKAYYEEELKRLRGFISRYGFLYQCYQLDAPDLDNVLFLHDAGPSGMVLPEGPAPDPEFSTAGDFLWAKFMAYDRLREWLEGELHKPGGSAGGGPDLKWTGESINLVELAYGIWLTGQLNNGNASITQIVEWLELHLQVNIGVAFRRWSSISGRKRVSQTKYIDQLKAAVLKRLDEENGMR